MAKIKITEEQAKRLMNEMLKITDTDVDNNPAPANPMDNIKKVAQSASKSPDLNRAINKGDVAMSSKTTDGYDVSAKKSASVNENIVSFKKMNEMKTKNLKKDSRVVSLNEFFSNSKNKVNEGLDQFTELKQRISVAYECLKEYILEDEKVRSYDLAAVMNNLKGAMRILSSDGIN